MPTVVPFCNVADISTATTTTLGEASGPGAAAGCTVHVINVLVTTTGTVLVKDGTTTRWTGPIGTAPGSYLTNLRTGTTTTVVTSAADSVKVSWFQ